MKIHLKADRAWNGAYVCNTSVWEAEAQGPPTIHGSLAYTVVSRSAGATTSRTKQNKAWHGGAHFNAHTQEVGLFKSEASLHTGSRTAGAAQRSNSPTRPSQQPY